MGIVRKLLGAAGAALVYACGATALAEMIILVSLWHSGAFEVMKMKRYAAVVYGYDLAALDLGDKKEKAKTAASSMTRDQLLDARVKSNATLATRQDAIRKGADDIRSLVQTLSTKRERYEIVKRGFDDLLVKLEQDVDSTALTEVRRTLEVLQPKQSKDLMIDMLQDGNIHAEDDVWEDVLTMIRGMPQDKLRKIFTEFKTEDERIVLNSILLKIGELDTQ